MLHTLRACLRDRTGATALEYGLIAAFVAVVIIASLTLLGTDLAAFYQSIADAI